MSRIHVLCGALVMSASMLATAAVARADVVLDWNVIALKTTAAAPFNPPVETRNLAIVHAAVFDAVNSITREFHAYAARHRAPSGSSPEAAAVAAAHHALLELYPDQRPVLDAAYSASLALIPDGPARRDGVSVGEASAAQMLALRANDGAAEAIHALYTP